MRLHIALVGVLLLFTVPPASAADALADARVFYNQGNYEAAASSAREALKSPIMLEEARLVLGRALLEIYRQTADQAHLSEARDVLKAIGAEGLDDSERTELIVGLGEHLFLEDRYGVASESFERALDSSATLGPDGYARVLDWWATALDRLALTRPREARQSIYTRIVARMEKELGRDPSSAPAAYWLASALRGCGDLDRAWDTARAGWITAMLGKDHGAALRADLDRLTIQAIIPDRAARLQPKDPDQAAAVMRSEWEALKTSWSR